MRALVSCVACRRFAVEPVGEAGRALHRLGDPGEHQQPARVTMAKIFHSPRQSSSRIRTARWQMRSNRDEQQQPEAQLQCATCVRPSMAGLIARGLRIGMFAGSAWSDFVGAERDRARGLPWRLRSDHDDRISRRLSSRIRLINLTVHHGR
jgi:hypothetical protein